MRKDELLELFEQSKSPMAPALIKVIKNYKKEEHIYSLAVVQKIKKTIYTFNFLVWDNKELLAQVDECYDKIKGKEALFLKIN